MPWRERSPMDERVQFLSDYLRQLWTMTQLCVTATASVARPPTNGRALRARARECARGAIVAAGSQRTGHGHKRGCGDRRAAQTASDLGGKKIVAVLRERHPTWTLPAISTANDILKRHRLVPPRRRRRALAHPSYQPTRVTAPNLVWTADFKGQFRTP